MELEKKQIVSNEWKVTNDRFVAFIDIMGFKDMVLKKEHNEIYEMMKKIDTRKKFSENIHWGEANEKLVRTTTYSDSIMIYSKDNTFNSLFSLICTVSSLSYYFFIEGIPFKGAVAFGTMTLDTENSIFFGQPLIDAYLLQEELNYYGIVFHATAEEEFDKAKKVLPFHYYHICPFKSGLTKHRTIMPMFAWNESNKTEEDILNHDNLLKAISKLRYSTSGHLRKYIDLTESYIQSINDQ